MEIRKGMSKPIGTRNKKTLASLKIQEMLTRHKKQVAMTEMNDSRLRQSWSAFTEEDLTPKNLGNRSDSRPCVEYTFGVERVQSQVSPSVLIFQSSINPKK